MIIYILLLLIAVVLIALYREFTKKSQVHLCVPPKVVGSTIPFIGNYKALVDPKNFFADAYNKYGGVCSASILGKQWIFVSSRENFKDYFSASQLPFEELLDHSRVARVVYGPKHEGFSHNNAIAVKKALGVRIIHVIDRVANECIDRLAPSGTLDVAEFSYNVIACILCEVLIGVAIPSKIVAEIKTYARACDLVAATSLIFRPIADYMLVGKADKARNTLLTSLEPFIAQARADRSSIPVYLNTALDSKHEDTGVPYTDIEVANLLAGILFAGVANTGNGLANMIVLGAEHPAERTELVEELKGADVDTVNHNKLGQAWVEETSRLSKGYINNVRICSQDGLVIAGYDIPKGFWTAIDSFSEGIATYEIENADKFKPERWLKTPKPFRNFNWGSGAMLCPGRGFAQAEMKFCAFATFKRLILQSSGKPFVCNPTFADIFAVFPHSYKVKYTKIE